MVWYLPGCSTYRITRTTPQQAVQGEERVILTVQDGSGVRTLYLEHPWATADSIGGSLCVTDVTGRGPGWRCQADSVWAAPISAVHSVQTKQGSTSKPLIIAGVVIAVLVVAGAVWASSATFGSFDLNK
jgi:hypothetical protein